MSKKPTKKTTKSSGMNETQFREELLYAVHLMKYNIYLLSKSAVFSSLLQHLPKKQDGTLDLQTAVGLTHGVLQAFHKQDHPEIVEKAKENSPVEEPKN